MIGTYTFQLALIAVAWVAISVVFWYVRHRH